MSKFLGKLKGHSHNESHISESPVDQEQEQEPRIKLVPVAPWAYLLYDLGRNDYRPGHVYEWKNFGERGRRRLFGCPAIPDELVERTTVKDVDMILACTQASAITDQTEVVKHLSIPDLTTLTLKMDPDFLRRYADAMVTRSAWIVTHVRIASAGTSVRTEERSRVWDDVICDEEKTVTFGHDSVLAFRAQALIVGPDGLPTLGESEWGGDSFVKFVVPGEKTRHAGEKEKEKESKAVQVSEKEVYGKDEDC
jgi:hypothetical protein